MIDTALELALAVLLAELTVFACVLLFVFMRTARRKEAQVKAEATALVEKVEISGSGRREALSTIFKSTYKFDDEEAEAAVSQFVERERAFYNFLLAVHLGRGGKKLTDVPNELAKVVAPWLRVTPKHHAEIEGLTQEKTRLETELTETKRVMEELLAEYSAAFRKGEDPITLDQAKPTLPAAPDDGLLSMDDLIPDAPVAAAVAGTPTIARTPAEPRLPLAEAPDPIHLEDPEAPLPRARTEVEPALAAVAEELAAEAPSPRHGLDFDIADEADALMAVLPDGGTADLSRMTEADIDALIEGLDHGADENHAAA